MYTLKTLKGKEIVDTTVRELLDGNPEMVWLQGKHSIGVDLTTGLFYINNMPFNAGLAFKDVNYRIITYTRQRMEVGVITGATKQYIHQHLLGWQFTEDGKNYQRILFLSPSTHIIEVRSKR